jgi:hypothetical protein
MQSVDCLGISVVERWTELVVDQGSWEQLLVGVRDSGRDTVALYGDDCAIVVRRRPVR